MKEKETLSHNTWWTLIPFVALSLINKIWVESDTLGTIAWAFFFLWSLTECIKDKGKNKDSFVIEAILSIAIFIVLAWGIADLIRG